MDFNNLLINRSDIENALGISIQTNSEYEYLNDYSMYEYLDLKDVVCVFLNIHPQDINYYQHPRYALIYNAIREAIKKETINGIITPLYDDYGNEAECIQINHNTARAWAKTFKLNWSVPPYKAVIINEQIPVTDEALQNENTNLREQLSQQAQQIEELKAQIEHLKTENQTAINYSEFSIYGHKTEGIEAIFKVIERFWVNADLNDTSTIENADTIIDWICEKYPSVGKSNAQAIQTITRPIQARFVGSKGNNKKGG